MENKTNYSRHHNGRALSQSIENSSSSSISNNHRAQSDYQVGRRQKDQRAQRNVRQQQQQAVKLRNNVDKRPRARAQAHETQAQPERSGSGRRESDLHASFENSPSSSTGLVSDDEFFDEPEFTPKGRNKKYAGGGVVGGNYNHLLNFKCTPRQQLSETVTRKRQSGGVGGHTPRMQYSKEQYLQANFQFVVRCKGKPCINGSPDALLDWSLIEQINLHTTEEPKCPICLYPATAAKLTRCGHAYCWTCILHYLSLSDKSWHQCPICYCPVRREDLKSCTIQQQEPISVGSEITLQLMRRRKDSICIEACALGEPNMQEQFPLVCADEQVKRFAKFLIARRVDVIDIVNREERELQQKMLEDPEMLEQSYIEGALIELNKRRSKLQAAADTQEQPIVEQNKDELATTSAGVANNARQYYFYQAADGQFIFLHSINIKMLQHQNDGLENAPTIIKGRVLQLEQLSMNASFRTKFTCLGHLPLTCQFTVVEIELKAPYVHEETVHFFEEMLKKRATDRARRQKEEQKREQAIERYNERQLGKILSSTANLNLSSAMEFPVCGVHEEPPFVPEVPVASTSTAASGTAYSLLAANISPSMDFSATLGAKTQQKKRQAKVGAWGARPPPQTPLLVAATTNASSDAPGGDVKLSEILSGALAESQQKIGRAVGIGSGKKQKRGKKMTPIFSTGLNVGHN